MRDPIEVLAAFLCWTVVPVLLLALLATPWVLVPWLALFLCALVFDRKRKVPVRNNVVDLNARRNRRHG